MTVNTTAVTPFKFNTTEIRTIQKDDMTWFVAKDICDALGLGNITEALAGIPNNHLTSVLLKSGTQTRTMKGVDEPGLYRLVLRSNKPEAEPFMEWVTSEVLPSIRKTGSYSVGNTTPESAVPVAREFRALLSIAKLAGLKGNPAVLSADQATRQVIGVSPLALIGHTQLVNETQERHFTPTELGLMCDMSAKEFNKKLVADGFQVQVIVGDRKYWKPTEKGQKYAVLIDTGKKHRSTGAMVQQLRWKSSVIPK